MVAERLPKSMFVVQRLQVPVISAAEDIQSNPMNPGRTYIPGLGLEYSVLSCDVIIDKHFKSYREILTWFKGIHAPEDKAQQALTWKECMTDVTVIGTDAANAPICYWQFTDAFPISVDGPMFDATMPDIDYLVSNVSFRFKYFQFSTFTGTTDNQEKI